MAAALVLGLTLGSEARAQFTAPLWPMGSRGLMLPEPRLGGGQLEDVYVAPMRPGQNKVGYWEHPWLTWDFTPDPGGGGVRLFFYEREKDATGYAAYAIRQQYDRLTELFHYLPRTKIPFVLYASYAEFQATNVFFVSEGTLGATDPRDLRMALPFFGNVKQFDRVSTHEMAHQFTIQKVRDASLGRKVENALEKFPLWFVEGLAEYATFEGMDPEGDLILRDLLLNPNPAKGYALPDFFDERAGGYIGVYKLGQARLTFLAQVYGHQKVVELLERSPEMMGVAPLETPTRIPADHPTKQKGLPPDAIPKGATVKVPPPKDFKEFVARVVGETPERIEERYAAWMKRRYFDDFLAARQSVSDFILYDALGGEPDSLAASDDGYTLVYRVVERDTGLSTLYLQDLRDPLSKTTLARDQRPGMESLHPVDRAVASVRGGKVLYAARSGMRDVLYVRSYETKTGPQDASLRAKLKVSAPERFELGALLEVYDPALSPDGKQVAFAAIDDAGFRDLYRLDLEGPNKGKVTRLTNDVWAEADLYWDGDRLLYVADATGTHEFNVFSLDLKTLAATRLTFHDKEDRHPMPALGGVVFRSMQSGKPDLWVAKDGQERQLTDLPVGVLAMAPSRDELLGIVYYRGEHRLYRMQPQALLAPASPVATASPRSPVAPASVPAGVGGTGSASLEAAPYPKAMIDPGRVDDYRPSDRENWRVEGGAAAVVGTAQAGAAGVAVTDLLRDHAVLVNAAIYGSLKLTDASLLYLYQGGRPEYGVGAFHTFEPRRDKTFSDVSNYFLQRAFGVIGLVRQPFDRFRRVEGSLELRGIERFGFTDYTADRLDEWERLNGGIEPELVASGSLGRDTTRLHMLAGPIDGSSALLTGSVGYLPIRQTGYARLLGDVQQRFRLVGRLHLALRGAGGTTWGGGRFAPQFFLSSIDNLRGFAWGDPRLLGDHYYVGNGAFIIPMDWLVQTAIFSGIYGVAGFDFGAAFDKLGDAWPRRSLAGVLGVNLGLGATLLQLHFGRLVDIGGVPGDKWQFNLGFRYLYM